MKAILYGLFFTALFCACNGDKSADSSDVKSAPVTPGIDNVDGNIPDTTRTIRLNEPLPKDSTLVNDSPAHR